MGRFNDKLQARWDHGLSVCVGLDSDPAKLPMRHIRSSYSYSVDEMLACQSAFVALQNGEELPEDLSFGDMAEILADTMVDFNEAIINVTKKIVCAYKPNSAFYEALGFWGLIALNNTIDHIREVAPEVPVILDYKRGDIGNTNAGYVLAAKRADAVTVHPYPGMEAMKPFLDDPDKGVIVLCRTSNPGAGEFQDLEVRSEGQYPTEPLYRRVARHVANEWNYNGNCGVVFGATYPDKLAEGRKIVGDMPILIPAVGTQGGVLETTVKAGADSRGQGMIISFSREVLFASSGADFPEAARTLVQLRHDDITAVLAAA